MDIERRNSISRNLMNCSKVQILTFHFFINAILSTALATSNYPDDIRFNYTSFSTNMSYEGDASSIKGEIQLTTNLRYNDINGSTGRATYHQPMHLWDESSGNVANFQTHFSFVIECYNCSYYGDGFAFFLAPIGSALQKSGEGGEFGLVGNSEINNTFIAVEFDTYPNYWDRVDGLHGIGLDEHVGIDYNSIVSLARAEWNWSDVPVGRRVDAWISYNSSTKNLSLYLTDDNEQSLGKNSTTLSYTIDLKLCLPEWVTFGFSGATGSSIETHTIYSWDFSSTLEIIGESVNNQTTSNAPPAPVKRKKKAPLGVVVSVGVGLLLLLAGMGWFFCWMMNNRDRDCTVNEDADEGELQEITEGPKMFSYKELVLATNNFSKEGFLGQGGFGKVYAGFLNETSVAVKKITSLSEYRQRVKEYASEVNIISKLRHKNLVKLIGWCHENNEFIIVYQFMPNKSLDVHIFGESSTLTWEKRYNIAKGLASALFYLQEECEQCVLHRDIKSSNVLLDLSFSTKLGDFGLARLLKHGKESHSTTLIGTVGFIAPEYEQSGKATKESDIYSYGVVLLEIACGKPALREVNIDGTRHVLKLVDWVWECYGKGNVRGAADARLDQNYDGEEMERLIIVGLACANPNHVDRPSIREVTDMLFNKAPLPNLPQSMPRLTIVAAPSLDTIFGDDESSSHGGASGFIKERRYFSGASFNSTASCSKMSTTSSTSNTT